MAVAQLYFHLAPKAEVGVIAKALVRLLRSHRFVAPGLWWCPTPPSTSVVGTHGELQDPVRDPQKADLWGHIRLEAFLEWPSPDTG